MGDITDINNLFWVAFAYPVDGVAHRRRAAEQIFVRDLFPVRLQRFPCRPAAIVITRDEGEVVELQSHAGKLWRAVDLPSEQISIADLLQGTGDPYQWSDYPFRHPMLPKGLSPFQCRPVDQAGLREVLADRRGRAESEVANLAKHVALIGDRLFRRAVEPVYTVSITPVGIYISAGIDHSRTDLVTPTAFFRADALENAVQFADGAGGPPVIDAQIELREPLSFRSNTQLLTMRHCAWTIFNQGFGPDAGIEWLSPSAFSAWAEFRDLATKLMSRRETSSSVDAGPTLRSLLTLCEALPGDQRHPAFRFTAEILARSTAVRLLGGSDHEHLAEEDEAALLALHPQK